MTGRLEVIVSVATELVAEPKLLLTITEYSPALGAWALG